MEWWHRTTMFVSIENKKKLPSSWLIHKVIKLLCHTVKPKQTICTRLHTQCWKKIFQNVIEIQYDFRCYCDDRMGNFAVWANKKKWTGKKTKNSWIKNSMEIDIETNKWKFLWRRMKLNHAKCVWRPWNGIFFFLYKFQANKERMAWQSDLYNVMTKRFHNFLEKIYPTL